MDTVTNPDILKAQTRVSKVLPVTPLTHSPVVSELVGIDVYFKWENKLKTGSFKERGAVNILSRIAETGEQKSVCAASAGNHALALSYHAAKLGIPCTIVMPQTAPLVKVESTQRTGAKVLLHGSSLAEAYELATSLAEKEGHIFVSPYDNLEVIAGQGTCGLEILSQLDDFDSVVVPVGGGGLISGIATAIKAKRPNCYLLGVRSDWAVELEKNPDAHKKLKLPRTTIADGIAVKRIGALNRPIIDKYVDELVSLDDAEVAKATIRFMELERTVVEGSGAIGLAALINKKLPAKFKKCVVIVSGSNIDMNFLSRLIERDMGERGRLLKMIVSVPDRPGSLHFATGIIATAGANVLDVKHDRSFSRIPGNVDITFLLEVRSKEHKKDIIERLVDSGIQVTEF